MNKALLITLLAVVAFVAGLLVARTLGSVGGTSNFDTVEVTGLKVGTSGTTFSQVIASTCTLIGTNVSHAASSTKPYDCAVTGVVSTDTVIGAKIATSTVRLASSGLYWDVVGTKASTTDGYITFLVYNNGPAAAPSSTSVGSSTPFILVR